jgi:hypothetical protein
MQKDEESTQVTLKLIENLIEELVIRQIPERLLNIVRSKVTTLEDTLLAIRHEDKDSRPVDREASEGWQVVPRRRPMAHAPPRRVRTPPRIPREKPERRPARKPHPREGLTRGRQEWATPGDNWDW